MRWRARPLPPGDADGHRAAPSAAFRRRRRPAARARHPVRAPQRRNRRCPRTSRVVLGDSMGEIPGYYAAADVAFVGGSLLPLGGQNLIEPIAVGAADALRSAHVQFRGGERSGRRAAGAALRRRRRTVLVVAGSDRAARRPRAARGDARRCAGVSRRASRRRRAAVGMARAAGSASAPVMRDRSGANCRRRLSRAAGG